MAKFPMPVDLNELPERVVERPTPAPIGGKPSPFAPKPRASTMELESSIAKVVEEINATKSERPVPVALANLDQISTNLCELLLGSAQNMITEAQNQLTQTQLWADRLKSEIATKIAEHAELTARLQEFGASVLKAHNAFHNITETEKSE